MNKSEISNEFNFDNQLDITQTKKDKTDQYFSKSGFAFEDFMNIGDKTMKSDKMSSKIYNNTSEILKKEQDSVINPNNIVDYLTQHSIKPKKTASVLENLSLTNSPQNLAHLISPKFADQMKTAKSIHHESKKQILLQRVQSGGRPNNVQENVNKNGSKAGAENAFKKKDYMNKMKQEEYKQLEDQLHYYEDSLQKIIYQSERMQDQTENLMASFNTNTYDIYLQTYSKEIQQINNQIQQERNLEAQLAKMVDQLQDEYQNLVNSIKTSNFTRPVKMKDQAKALVDQINTLKAEFQALERDDGSLNLSSTLLQNQSSHQQAGNTFRLPAKKDSKIGNLRIQQIYAQNKKSEDPRFLYNIKMACLRDEWNIYSNSQIQINVSYRSSPKIKLTLGNKISKDLQKFSFKQGTTSRLQGQTISAKSYIVHQIQIKQDIVDQLFIKCELNYSIQNVKRSIYLFIPTGITNFGDFSPMTQKQFSLDAGKQESFQNSSGFRPLDKKLINNITEIEYYMPNLLIDRDNYKCFGLFISPFNEFTFLIIRQKGQLASIASKTPNWPLIRILEFIFTL